MSEFEGKRVIVTGGSRGIGRSIVEEFAQRGARVALLARNLEAASEVATAIDGDVTARALDVSDAAAVAAVLGGLVSEWDGVDVLVNNAGVTRDKLLPMMKDDDWEFVMGVNLRGTFLCSRALLRPMLKQRSGRIVNITSVVGLTGNAGQANYAASKAGVVGFTKSLAKEIASRNVTVNAVAPGMIDTDMTRDLGEAVKEQILAGIPMRRLGESREVASVVLFLSSAAAGYVTGEVIRVDGGMAC